MTPRQFDALKRGLAQIPRDGLERLRDHIAAGKPMVVGSDVVVRETRTGRAIG